MLIEFVSDSAVLVSLNGAISKETSLTVLSLFHHLQHRLRAWPVNFHPAFRSLLVDFDSSTVSARLIKFEIEKAMGSFQSTGTVRGEDHEIPVQYDGEDLNDVARSTGMSIEEVIRLHSQTEFTVAFLGFAPGFPYLIGLPEKLQCARKKTPRVRVPAGSVAIAGPNCGIYPEESPGGWQLLGRTNLKLNLQPGDRVRFTPATNLQFLKSVKTAEPDMFSRFAQVESGAVLTGVRDCGQSGLTHLGISPGGAADPLAFATGNQLAGNEANAEALEILAAGPVELQFLQDTWFCVTGADCAPALDQIPIAMWSSLPVSAGQLLSTQPARQNLRSYVCVNGTKPSVSPGHGKADKKISDIYSRAQNMLRVTRGPQWDWFSSDARENIFAMEFTVTNDVNRQGVRLTGTELAYAYDFSGKELVSEGIANGAIQVAANGLPMILFCEQRTTGGYPKIANVAAADLWKIGQLRPGQKLRFNEISLEDSWQLLT